MRPRLARYIIALSALLFAGAISTGLYGQAVTGSLLGTVTDASGGTVPNAKVSITEVNTGLSRTMETNSSGNYSFPTLEPGIYRVTVEHAGFRKEVREGVELLVNTTVRSDATLQ